MKPILFWCLCLFSLQVYAQQRKPPGEFGKPDLEWWSKSLTSDTTASAILLFDYARCKPESNLTQLIVRRRIKILKSSAFEEWSNISILTADQRISNFECTVYNLENGAIVETVVNKRDLLREKLIKGLKRAFVPVPAVKEGSVIEYTYTIITSGFNLSNWQAQESIPVQWSEYEIYFGDLATGVIATVNGVHRLTDVDRSKKGWRTYLFTDLPAFIPEPDIPYESYFKSSITFRPSYSYGPYTEEYRVNLIAKFGFKLDSLRMDTKFSSRNNLKVTDDGELQGEIEIRKSGYEAIRSRKFIKITGNEDYMTAELTADNLVVNHKELLNERDSTKDLVLKANLTIENQIQKTDSLIYVNPFITYKNESNPYKLEERKYPLDLGSRMVKTVTTVIAIPEGYKVDELPKNSSLALPNRIVTFLTNASVIGNAVYITTTLKTTKIVFDTTEYLALREFYGRMVSKKSDLIVFRKKKV